MKQSCYHYNDCKKPVPLCNDKCGDFKPEGRICYYYGDCPFVVYDCPEDEPHATCKHRRLSKPNASVSIPGGEPGYDPSECSPSFLKELKRIAHDYMPENDSQSALALSEMREALISLLANAHVELPPGDASARPPEVSSDVLLANVSLARCWRAT